PVSRVALLEVLHDHLGLRQDEPLVLLVDGHLAQRVLLVDQRRPVVEVDLDRLVRDPLLRERDPRARGVRATVGGVEGRHFLTLTRAPRLPVPSPRRSAAGARPAAAGPGATKPFARPPAPAPAGRPSGVRRPSGSSPERARPRAA